MSAEIPTLPRSSAAHDTVLIPIARSKGDGHFDLVPDIDAHGDAAGPRADNA